MNPTGNNSKWTLKKEELLRKITVTHAICLTKTKTALNEETKKSCRKWNYAQKRRLKGKLKRFSASLTWEKLWIFLFARCCLQTFYIENKKVKKYIAWTSPLCQMIRKLGERKSEMKKMENKLGSHNNILRIVIVVENRAAADTILRDLSTFPFRDLAHLGNLLPNAIFSLWQTSSCVAQRLIESVVIFWFWRKNSCHICFDTAVDKIHEFTVISVIGYCHITFSSTQPLPGIYFLYSALFSWFKSLQNFLLVPLIRSLFYCCEGLEGFVRLFRQNVNFISPFVLHVAEALN